MIGQAGLRKDCGHRTLDYIYDKVGNILSESAGTTTTHYGYDKAGQGTAARIGDI